MHDKDMILLERRAIYDELSAVLTNYEHKMPAKMAMCSILSKINESWDGIITADSVCDEPGTKCFIHHNRAAIYEEIRSLSTLKRKEVLEEDLYNALVKTQVNWEGCITAVCNCKYFIGPNLK